MEEQSSANTKYLTIHRFFHNLNVYQFPLMSIHVKNTADKHVQASVESKQGSQISLVDNRPEALAQRKLQALANNSEQVRQLRTKQEKVDHALGVGVEQNKNSSQLSSQSVVQAAQGQISSSTTGGNPYLSGSRGKGDGFKHEIDVQFPARFQLSTGEYAGTQMIANPIGPNHPAGSAPDSSVFPKYMALLHQKYAPETFVRGHLLNGDLGGPGALDNLYPITSQANSHHFQYVEKPLKAWINDQFAYAYYQVSVQQINKGGKEGYAEFHCVAYPLQEKPSGTLVQANHSAPINKVIVSDPGSVSGTADTQNTYALGAAMTEKASTVGGIEYQLGKLPVGFVPINEVVSDFLLDNLQTIYANQTKFRDAVSLVGVSRNGAEALMNFVVSGEIDFDNRTIWNAMANKINSSPEESIYEIRTGL
ncbi:MAG: hypothetical protein AAF206_03595 [Bacteroidota bacterium]